jgi:hypothetical protein
MRDQPVSCAWNPVKEACTFRVMGVFSDSSLTTFGRQLLEVS